MRPHQIGDVPGIGDNEMQVDPGIFSVKRPEIVRYHVGRDRGGCADAQRSAVEIAQRQQFVLRRALGRKQRLRMPHQRLSLPRRPHALRRPVEQAAADLKLEIPHPLRDRRLADMEGVGCAREASGSHHRREQAQQMQVQGHNFPLSGQIENILPNYRDQTHKSFSPQEKLVPQDEEFSAPGNGPASSVSRLAALIPGVLLCVVLAGISAALEAAERRLFAHPYVEALVLAILLGMVVRSIWSPSERWLAGIAFSAKQLLEVAVMLLGASISFAAIAASGIALLGAIAATVVVT